MTFAADYKGAIVVEAKRYARDQLCVPMAWGLHTPEEPPDDYPGTPWYFHNNDVGSTHYFAAWTGFIYQCVPENRRPYANPRNKGTPFPWEDPNRPLDTQTMSVEIEGYAATIHLTMPRGCPQWVSLVRLMADRCKVLDFPPERAFGHYEVSTQRSDPGQLDIGALVQDVRSAMTWEVHMGLTDQQAQELADIRRWLQGQAMNGEAVTVAGQPEFYLVLLVNGKRERWHIPDQAYAHTIGLPALDEARQISQADMDAIPLRGKLS